MNALTMAQNHKLKGRETNNNKQDKVAINPDALRLSIIPKWFAFSFNANHNSVGSREIKHTQTKGLFIYRFIYLLTSR
jgi:hypothetical protein